MVPCRNAAEQQILLSQNGALVNVVYHMRNPDTKSARITGYYARNLLNWLLLRRIIEIDTSRCQAKMHQIRFPLGKPITEISRP